MILLEINDKKTYPRDFVRTLITVYKHKFILKVLPKRLTAIENTIKERYLERVPIYLYCITAIDSAIIVELNDKYIVKVDPNKRIKEYKLDTLISFINNGDLESKPYPIFTEISNDIISSLLDLFLLYKIGVTI